MFIYGILIINVNRGLDLTDESYYLLNYSNYQDVTSSVTFFGTIFRPIYELGGQSIALLRLIGIVILALVSAITGYITLQFATYKTEPHDYIWSAYLHKLAASDCRGCCTLLLCVASHAKL